MSERFRFRKMIERPNWTPPQAVSLEIEYVAEPVEVPYGDEEESIGGIRSIEWHVALIKGPLGQYHHPHYFFDAQAALEGEPGLMAELRDYCLEDYAHRR